MNELAVSMSKIADFATNGISKGVDVLLKQAPEIAAQFLKFKLFVHGFTALLLIILTIIIMIFGFITVKALYKVKSEYDDVNIASKILGGIIAVGSFFSIGYFLTGAYTNFIQYMYIILAPKVYLIEFFSKLIK